MKQNGLGFSTLKRVLIGGSACPESLIRGFQEDFGVEVTHAWGMTETSPIGTIANLPPEILKLPYDEQMKYRLKQGVPPLGIELKLKDEAGAELPHDGATFGRLMVKGPTISKGYFKDDSSILDDEGFFDTGDVATVDEIGFMQITDRAKDVINVGVANGSAPSRSRTSPWATPRSRSPP